MATANRRSRIKLKWHILSHLSDRQLVWLYEETGVTEYFSELFMRYLPLVYGMCLKYVPDEEQAKDAVKRLFDSALEEFDKTDITNEVFRDWLYRHTHDFLVAYSKENRRYERNYFSAKMESTLSDRAYEYAKILDAGGDDARRLFDASDDMLSKQEKLCLEQFFLKRKSFRSIASSTGYLTGNIKKHIETGLEKMADKTDLLTAGFTLDDSTLDIE